MSLSNFITSSFLRVLCIVMLSISVSCQAKQTQSWTPEIRDMAAKSIELGDCDKFWHHILPFAKQSEPEAAFLIASAIYAHGFVPPNASNDVLFRMQSMISGFGHSARSGEPKAIEMLTALLETEVFRTSGGRTLSTCLANETDKSICIDNAIANNLFPSFSQWVNEMELLGKSGDKAFCKKTRKNQKLTDDEFEVIAPK